MPAAVWSFAARTEPAWMPAANAKPLRPGRAAHRWKQPPPDRCQGSPQEAGALRAAPDRRWSSRMDAATLQQDLKPRTQPQTNHAPAAWMRRQFATPGTAPPCSRTPSTTRSPSRALLESRTATRSHPAEGRRQDAAGRVVVHSENRGGRMPPAIAKPLRPGRAAHRWKRPPPDQPQGSPQEAGAYEPRRTGDGRAAWMRRRCNKTSSRALNLRPTTPQPHGCGQFATPGTAPPCSRTPSTTRSPSRALLESRTATRSHPALKVGGRMPPAVWWFTARTEAAGCRRRLQSLCGPDGPHIDGNGHRRTSPRAARRKRASMSNAGPAMVEPHGGGGAATRPQAAHPT